MEKVWALFDNIEQFGSDPAAEYANPFLLDDGKVLAFVYADAWSGPMLTEAEALVLIDEQPLQPPPPDPPPPGLEE
tara:strand:- start:384 stop:611 length:228 start_codon:yes stop_codon:yes gene_type:complete